MGDIILIFEALNTMEYSRPLAYSYTISIATEYTSRVVSNVLPFNAPRV